MAVETREVCKMCFNSSSHKPNPTLTPIHKALVDSDRNRSCPACKQQWLTETVAKDGDRWVAVRLPPKIDPLIDYRLCVNIRKKQPSCRNGTRCTYAHNIVELKEWNRKRYQQPRPAPNYNLHGPYQMCKNIQKSGICRQQCKFAHSKEELEQWMKEKNQHGLKTSHRLYRTQTARRMSSTRPRPYIVFANHGYKMCKSVQLQRPCYHGDNCYFAHSKEELQLWNEEISSTLSDYINVPAHQTSLSGNDTSPFDTTSSSGIRDDKNFDQILRTKVILSLRGQTDVLGHEVTLSHCLFQSQWPFSFR